ncbi:hypothetical protein D3C81_1810280 [compost metagenome]
MQKHRNLPHANPRCIHLAEHLLQPYRQHWRPRISIVQWYTRSAGHCDMRRSFFIQSLAAAPIQHSFQCLGQRQPLQIPQIAHSLNIRPQPLTL